MGKLYVNLQEVLSSESLPKNSNSTINQVISSITSTISSCDSRIRANTDVSNPYNKIISNLKNAVEQTTRTYTAVDRFMNKYRDTEASNFSRSSKFSSMVHSIIRPLSTTTMTSAKNSFKSVPTVGAKISGASGQTFPEKDKSDDKNTISPNFVGEYLKKVSDAEYARICGFWSDVADDPDPGAAFLKKLSTLPGNDPLKTLSIDHTEIIKSSSGLSVITITDDSGNALVIFAGTNVEDMGDLVADTQLTLGRASEQSKEANALIKRLSNNYNNIVVTGHSLGGYLATSAALNNSSVSRCIAFDPPGRYDMVKQITSNTENYAKVTTYEANGSVVSAVGYGVGKVKRLNVKENWAGPAHNHGIKQICDALGGNETITKTWNPDNRGSSRNF